MCTAGWALLCMLAAIAAPGWTLPPPIELDDDAMAALARSHPTHHRRAVLLLTAAGSARCGSAELKRIRVQLDVGSMDCSEFLLTSEPPKRRITFTLDRTRYAAVVTLRNADATLVPAR
jgi:hypothetical protein